MSAPDSRPALPIHLPFDSISPSFSKNSPCVFQVLGYYLTSLGEMPCGWLLCTYEENNEHGGKMIYQQDWLMRQIEAMIQAILAVALGISANEQTATQIEDSSYGKMLEKMIDDGDICAAEDLLFNDLDQSDLSWLQIALDFYSKLNNCSDDYLAMHDFSREEIDQGLRYICTLFGYDFFVSN